MNYKFHKYIILNDGTTIGFYSEINKNQNYGVILIESNPNCYTRIHSDGNVINGLIQFSLTNDK